MCKLHNLPDDPNVTTWQVGFTDGQLLPHGASRELIQAVASGEQNQIEVELQNISDPAKRERLIGIIQRLAPIIAKHV
jgi:hypothetical protein